ncbi:sorting nexin-29 isoform C [Alligator mississippiensis]|uniref:Sorting nexin-29 isoform C n=1 Tax=Alligator mississippiensis TaxID=8496 RepID=A0A151N1B9_ALLMI|nr:sorting nexin-29 isoform C [Alligator mississippiensis]
MQKQPETPQKKTEKEAKRLTEKYWQLGTTRENLLQSCKPCHLRCSSKPPFSCQNYCNESAADPVKLSHGIIWICLGIGILLTFAVFVLMVLFKRRYSKPSKEEIKITESSMELNIILQTDTESCVNADGIGETLQRSQNNDAKRQFLLERLLDAVKQCQIRFGGRKEIASDSDSRVTCLCAQFEAVFQHGLKRSRGLALTAAAIKQAAGFSSKTETEPVFWYYVKEVLNKHELQRFYSLKTITTDIGRGRAWLRCALNEHSLERYVHMLLADKNRLSVFYEDWSFMMDEERSSMIPTMAAGLNSILFAINIDNKDLNGQSKCTPTVSDLLKESTQNVTSLLKESTQGVSSLLREITASSAVSILIKSDQDTDPLPVLSKTANADLKCKKERKKKKRVTHIISFDEEEDEQNFGEILKTSVTGESSEENSDRSSLFALPSSEGSLGQNLNGNQNSHLWKSSSPCLNGEYGYQKLDVKSIDDEDIDENEDEIYGKVLGNKDMEDYIEISEKPQEGGTCNSQIGSWTPLQVLNDDSHILFPVSALDSYSQTDALENGDGHDSAVLAVELAQRGSELPFRVEVNPAVQVNALSNMLPSVTVPESMTINELRQAIVAMMNRKDELEEQNRSLRNLLDGEMEHSAALRQEIDNLRKKVAEQEERHAAKIQALTRLFLSD